MNSPKRLLVVCTTLTYRHDSIGIGSEVLTKFAQETGLFLLDFVHQPADKADMAEALLPLSPKNLASYDGVIFNSTTGDLPLPDRDGFLRWIADGHAFIGMHSATDTLHGWPEFVAMQGGEFAHHGEQHAGEVRVLDASHPATQGLGEVWHVEREEWYEFKNLAPGNHELLALDVHPSDGSAGHFPLAWTRSYGEGRVFSTGIGHREDLFSTDPKFPGRVNSVAVSEQFRAHLLGGILWALNLA